MLIKHQPEIRMILYIVFTRAIKGSEQGLVFYCMFIGCTSKVHNYIKYKTNKTVTNATKNTNNII